MINAISNNNEGCFCEVRLISLPIENTSLLDIQFRETASHKTK